MWKEGSSPFLVAIPPPPAFQAQHRLCADHGARVSPSQRSGLTGMEALPLYRSPPPREACEGQGPQLLASTRYLSYLDQSLAPSGTR